MTAKKAGRWTRRPPQGENIVAFLQDPKGVADFVRENHNKANLGKTAWLNPQIAVRMIDKELGPLWVVLGEGTWTEEHLISKGVVWWSKPVDIPMIQVVFPKELVSSKLHGIDFSSVFTSLDQDLGRENPPAGQSDPGPQG